MPISAAVARVLETRALHAYYDESHVLRGVDLRVEKGEVVTLVGRNGAGKTTTLKSIMGIVRKTTGDITFEDAAIRGLSSDKIAKRGIGFVPEERGIYASLTVTENLTLPPITGTAAWSLERIYALFPALRERGRAMGTTLSGGEQQMLAIARVLRSGARLILLDEPTEGLAPVIVDAIGDLLLEIKASGITVLLVEPNMRFATRVADRHYLMVHGKIVESLTNAEAMARENDLLAHLGV
ncbi:MAG: ABC transporter ATP-binding protein [Candidatus Eremiobacteraeota bacterium]|nr:ABC transporter ATP-binding protein [Candidatus Eremiobacteraeota bacterium]